MTRQPEQKSSGVRLGVMNLCITAVALLVSAMLILITYHSIEGYHGLQAATERYIRCQQDAHSFQEGSDALTNECRYFALNGDVKHVLAFVEEVEVTRRRDAAVEDLAVDLQQAQSYGYLAGALRRSNALMEVECYAMRLAAVVWNVDPALLPGRVRDIQLEPADLALTVEEQRARVVELLFGADYVSAKSAIYENIDRSINALIEDTRTQQIASGDHLSSQLRRQLTFIVVLVLLLAAIVIYTFVLLIRPLAVGVRHIREGQKMPVAGSREMRFLAQTYNDMYERQSHHTAKLTYSATHDALTGLSNRAAYDAFREELDESSVGVLAIDVDHFKTFNDTYGHDVGDAVLKRVAKVLQDSFRSNDFVARVGGDEFTVVMIGANSGLSQLVLDKVRRANERLAQPEEGMPPISLSVGVAFGDRQSPSGDIFKDADTALYVVKRGGRGGCAIYPAREPQLIAEQETTQVPDTSA